jgi:hypothetical protein
LAVVVLQLRVLLAADAADEECLLPHVPSYQRQHERGGRGNEAVNKLVSRVPGEGEGAALRQQAAGVCHS